VENTCPFCGAEGICKVTWTNKEVTYDFDCGTEQVPGGVIQSDECKFRQQKLKDE
jgi:hypothetical protein